MMLRKSVFIVAIQEHKEKVVFWQRDATLCTLSTVSVDYETQQIIVPEPVEWA